MFTKIALLCAIVSSVRAGLIAAPHAAITSHSSVILGAPAYAHAYAAPAIAAPAYGYAHAAPIISAPAVAHYPAALPIAHAPAAYVKAAPVEVYAHPKYQFNYGVADGHTGDQKSQWEARDGDVVKGQYSLVEADGTIRTVDYTADDHNGFNAVVSKHGHAAHPGYAAPLVKAVVAAPAIAHAPIYAGYH